MLIRFVALALLCFPVSAFAQEPTTGFYAGGFAAVSSDPYVGDNGGATGVPIFGYRGDGFSIGTNGASATVMERGSSALEAFLKPRFFTLTDPDSPALVGIDRNISVDAGLSYSVDLTERTAMDVSFSQEITGEHDGQEADLRLTQRFALGRFPVGIYAGATWRSSDLSSFLYGVRPAEALAGRPAYGLGATTTPYLGIQAALPVTDSMRVFGNLQADFFNQEIEDSPIVEDDTTLSLGVGIQFSF